MSSNLQLPPVAAPRFDERDRVTLSSQATPKGRSFEATLSDAVGQVSKLQSAAEAQNQSFATTSSGQLHENMIALEKANVALRMMVSVRNRVVEAYRDLMHMS